MTEFVIPQVVLALVVGAIGYGVYRLGTMSR